MNQIKNFVKQYMPEVVLDFLAPPRCRWSQVRLEREVRELYRSMMGSTLDLNHPVLFTEKLQWYKLYYHNPELARIVDKVNFKDYIREKLGEGHTIELYGAWRSIQDFKRDWAMLPKQFVLKSTLQSDGRYIRVIRDKDSVNLKALCREMKEWLKARNTLMNSDCSAYYAATPRILAEAYVAQIEDQLYDYKFFCFDGKPFCCYVATNHFLDPITHPITFFDLQWNKLDVRYGHHENSDVARPPHFEQMIEVAKKLSSDFPFVRVDFFDTEEKLYLAELTFYPGGGLTPYYPESFNREMGDLFRLPQR